MIEELSALDLLFFSLMNLINLPFFLELYLHVNLFLPLQEQAGFLP